MPREIGLLLYTTLKEELDETLKEETIETLDEDETQVDSGNQQVDSSGNQDQANNQENAISPQASKDDPLPNLPTPATTTAPSPQAAPSP